MSNVIKLSAFKGVRTPKARPSENVAPFEPRVMGRRRAGQNMHTFVLSAAIAAALSNSDSEPWI